MGHGGARDGAGRKPKWRLNGKPLKTKLIRIPEVIPDGEINEFIRLKLIELEENDNKAKDS